MSFAWAVKVKGIPKNRLIQNAVRAAGMTGRGDGELLTFELGARPQHGDRLQQLHR